MSSHAENSIPSPERQISTGLEGLDAILCGGFPEDHLYLIEGDPGTGKTTFALQFLLEGHRRGEPVLYIALSESERELRMISRSHGWNLENVHIVEVMPAPESLMPEDQYTVFHPGDVELGTTLKGILETVKEIKPTRVVFDSLSEIRLLARDSSRFRRQMLGLKQFFTSRHCTALLLDDRPQNNNSDTTVLSIVHGVIRLERMSREYGSKRRRLEVVKLRGLKFHDGYHDYNIRTGGLVVYPRLVAVNHQPAGPAEGSLSGVAQIDDLLGGGLDRGTSTLLVGPAGCGKSSIAIQYAAAAAERGEFVGVYLFDEGLTTLFKRSRALGQDLEKYIAGDRMMVQQLDPAEIAPGDFIDQIRRTIAERGLRVLVIDSLNGFLNAMPGEQLLTVQLHELLSFLNQRGVVTILVMAQYGILGSALDSPVDLSYLADTVVLLRYFESGGKVHKAISVVKKRGGAHEDTVRELKVGPGCIMVGEPLTRFHGVLSGVPTYTGDAERLMNTDDYRQR
jgi:circadian clock protein KaiC